MTTAIEERKNLDTMRVEALMSAIKINSKQRKNEKTITFKSAEEKAENVESHGDDDDEDELALFTKNFHKF